MKILILTFCIFVSYLASSQSLSPEGVFSATGNLSNSHAQICWTLGDAQIETFSKGELILTQGFLQSNISITGITNVADNGGIDLKVFPNPVSDFLNVKYSAEKEISIFFYLYNLQGSLLFSKKVNSMNYSETINFNQFENGTYLLKAVSSDKSYIRTFKILYQN